jgi:DNA-binding NarL/FixJ family response regulator
MLGPRKPNRNHSLLLVSEHQEEQEGLRAAIQAAGYDEDQIVSEMSDRAMDYLYSRNDYKETRPPSLIIIDLNHTTEEGRKKLASILEEVKAHPNFRLIPILLLIREENPDYLHAWYTMGIHACLARPEDQHGMIKLFESVRNYWSKRVILPELQ